MPAVTEQLQVVLPGLATGDQKRLFLAPGLLITAPYEYSLPEQRHYDLELKEAYQCIDSMTLDIPDGYMIEHIPGSISLDTEFGSYAAACTASEGKWQYSSRYVRKKGHFGVATYAAYLKFLRAIDQSRQAKLVLVKKNG